MELHQLKIFNAVAVNRSCTKASAQLHISQPALSMQLKKLEQQLGLKLFDKSGNKIVLNTNGQLLYSYTKKIFELVDQAEYEFMNIKGVIGGSLTIGGSNTIGTYIMPKIIGRFKTDYPHVKINLHIANTEEITKLIELGDLDFAVNGGDSHYVNTIKVAYLMKDRLVISASPNNPLAHKPFIQKEDLNDQEFIAHDKNSQLFKSLHDFFDEMEIDSKISTTLGNISAIKQAVSANLGLSLIPYSALVEELKSGAIKELSIPNHSITYPYNLIYNKNKYISPAGFKLIEYIHQIISEQTKIT